MSARHIDRAFNAVQAQINEQAAALDPEMAEARRRTAEEARLRKLTTKMTTEDVIQRITLHHREKDYFSCVGLDWGACGSQGPQDAGGARGGGRAGAGLWVCTGTPAPRPQRRHAPRLAPNAAAVQAAGAPAPRGGCPGPAGVGRGSQGHLTVLPSAVGVGASGQEPGPGCAAGVRGTEGGVRHAAGPRQTGEASAIAAGGARRPSAENPHARAAGG